MNQTPPLGGATCPDPVWAVDGGGLWIQGLENMVGPRWIIMLDGVGEGIPGGPAPPEPPVPPQVLPEGPEGAIPYLDDLRTP